MKTLLAILLFVFAWNLSARNITATSGDPGSVQAAINSAGDGDTVLIPDGNYNWTSGVTDNKAITLKAETLGGVTITDKFPDGNLINWTTSSGGHTEIAGLNFLAGSGNSNSQYVSLYDGKGSGDQTAILHNCHFEVPSFQIARAVDWQSTGGLIYNCVFDASHADGGNMGPGTNSAALRVMSWYPWYNTSTWGTQDKDGNLNCYIEDCTFIMIYAGAVDVDDMARVVIRHCDFDNSAGINHGITSMWGGRQTELYNNEFRYHQVPPNSAGYPWCNLLRYWWCRGGTMRISHNKVQTIWSNHFWNASASWSFIDEPLTRPGSGNDGAVELNNDYPGTRWAGTGSNGTNRHPTNQTTGVKVSPSYVDPVYIWGNTDVPAEIGGGPANPGSWWSTSDQYGYGRDPVPGVNYTADVFVLNRDIFLSAPAGYTPYVYPHPLHSTGGGPNPTPTPTPPTPTPTPSPSPTPVPTPTPQPTPSPTPTPVPIGRYSEWLDKLSEWIHTHPATPNP